MGVGVLLKKGTVLYFAHLLVVSYGPPDVRISHSWLILMLHLSCAYTLILHPVEIANCST